jgi:hypothetical protein
MSPGSALKSSVYITDGCFDRRQVARVDLAGVDLLRERLQGFGPLLAAGDGLDSFFHNDFAVDDLDGGAT